MRYIQELFGYKSSKTTEIYTHVSNKDLSSIQSPLDLIMKKEVGKICELEFRYEGVICHCGQRKGADIRWKKKGKEVEFEH